MTPNRDFSFYSFVFSNTLCIPNFFRISMDCEASCLVLTFNKHVACEDTRDCIANHSAFRTPNLLKREKEKEKKGGDQAGRTKHFLRRINALCGVNYQLRQGEVACADGARDVKSNRWFAACREPPGDCRTSLSDEWHTNRPLNDMQSTKHGQTESEVETLREVNSPRWLQHEWVRARGRICQSECVHTRERMKKLMR